MKKILAATVLAFLSATASGDIRMLALDGVQDSSGLGTYSVSLADSVSISGEHIAFSTALLTPAQTYRDAVMLSSCRGDPTIVAQAGESLPNTNVIDTLRLYGGPTVSANGLMTIPVDSFLAINPNAPRTDLAFATAGGIETLIVGDGDPAPGGDGSLFQRLFLVAGVNPSGQVAVSASLVGTSGGHADDEAVYRWDRTSGQLTEIARKGGPAPGGSGTYTGTALQASQAFTSPFIGADGRVAFVADIDGSGLVGDNGVFVSDGATTETFFRMDQVLPDEGKVDFVDGYDFNASAGVVASVSWRFTSSSLDGIYRSDGSMITRIASTGQAAPSGGTFILFQPVVKHDENGKAVFGGKIYQTSQDGIFSGSGPSITQLALEGTAAPEGRGNFIAMGRYTISPGGFIAFDARTDQAVKAIYRQLDGPIEEVISTADTIEGSQITDLALGGFDFGQAAGINDRGDVPFKFELADGRYGIAVAMSDSAVQDDDGDTIANACDNCLLVPNPLQIDADSDGHGNRCDADFNQDCIVNSIDLGIMRSVFFGADATVDINGDGVVNVIDLGYLRTLFFQPPGPSANGSCD